MAPRYTKSNEDHNPNYITKDLQQLDNSQCKEYEYTDRNDTENVHRIDKTRSDSAFITSDNDDVYDDVAEVGKREDTLEFMSDGEEQEETRKNEDEFNVDQKQSKNNKTTTNNKYNNDKNEKK